MASAAWRASQIGLHFTHAMGGKFGTDPTGSLDLSEYELVLGKDSGIVPENRSLHNTVIVGMGKERRTLFGLW